MESVRARCVSAGLPDPRVCALRSNYLLYVGLVVSAESPRMLGWRGGSSGPRTHVPSQAQGRVYF